MKNRLFLTLLAITQIFVTNAQVSLDASVTDISTPNFIAAPSLVDISFFVTNVGTVSITELDAEWTDGTTTYSQTFSTYISSTNSPVSFTFSDQLSISIDTNVNITVTVTNVNGLGVDDDQSNDSKSTIIHGIGNPPSKLVVGELATGMWCQWCPRGWDYMDYMYENYSNNWIGIAVHNNDPLMDSIYNDGLSAELSGYPSAHIDRAFLSIEPANFEYAYNQRVTIYPPAGINVSALLNDSVVDITVTADFTTNVTADYRLNCVVVENEVEDSSYNQANAYYQGPDPLFGYGYDWSSFPHSTPGHYLAYQYVARAILGGWDGELGSVPSSVTNGQAVSYNWSYPVNDDFDVNNLVFIGMLIDNSTGEILNAGRSNATTSIAEESVNLKLNIYPNPFSSNLNVELELEKPSNVSLNLFNATEQKLVMQKHFALIGTSILKLNREDLHSGIYFIEIDIDGQKIRKKVIVAK